MTLHKDSKQQYDPIPYLLKDHRHWMKILLKNIWGVQTAIPKSLKKHSIKQSKNDCSHFNSNCFSIATPETLLNSFEKSTKLNLKDYFASWINGNVEIISIN